MRPPERLRRLAAHLEAQMGHSRADQIAASAMLRSRPQPVHHRWPVLAAAAAAALISVVGVGAIADRAVPGQVLYPLDRAYESVGQAIGLRQNRSVERLVEALALLERGESVNAVQLVDEALTEIGRDPDLEGYHVAVAEIVAEPVPTTAPPVTSTTLPSDSPAPDTVARAVDEQPPVATVAAEADPATSLRLATEYLLRTVRDAKVARRAGVGNGLTDELRAAATGVVAAAQVVKDQAEVTAPEEVAQETTTSTTTTSPAAEKSTTTTSTTAATTTTSANLSTTTTLSEETSTTTSTTVAGGQETQGPIVLPVQP